MTIRAVVWGENVHERQERKSAPSIPTACTRPSPPRLPATGHRGIHRDPPAARARPDRRRGSTRPTCCSGGATSAHGDVDDDIVERVAEARLGGHGPDRPALRPLLQDLQAPDGHALPLTLARGRRARARSGSINRSHPIVAGLPDRIELAQRGDVRRALRRARAAGDRASSPGSRAARCSAPA